MSLEPKKVERKVKARIKIITGNQEWVEAEYARFIDHIMSYGAIIKGTPYSSSSGEVDNMPYTDSSICICYEIATNVTDKMINEYKETEALKQKLRESIAQK